MFRSGQIIKRPVFFIKRTGFTDIRSKTGKYSPVFISLWQ
jgi:hypothetical protein